MKNLLILLSIAVVSTSIATAQPEYKSAAEKCIKRGDYEEALLQIEAAMATLDIKKVSKYSGEYLELEKLKLNSQKCKSLFDEGQRKLSAVTANSKYIDEFVDAISADDMLKVAEKYQKSIEGAKSCFSEILAKFPQDKVTQSKFSECKKLISRFASFPSFAVYRQEWLDACQIDSDEAYNRIINCYPESQYALAAKIRMKDLSDWNKTKKENTRKAYQSFIKKHPSSAHTSIAQRQINRIDEFDDWQTARNLNTISAYRNYLSKTRTFAYGDEAKFAIDSLEQVEAVNADAVIWNKTKMARDSKSFSSYLNRNGYKAHVDEANLYFHYWKGKEASAANASYATIFHELDIVRGKVPFSDEDETLYFLAKEDVAFSEFLRNYSLEHGLRYIEEFPEGAHVSRVKDICAGFLAKKFNSSTTVEEYELALSYASNRETIKFVKKSYKKRK